MKKLIFVFTVSATMFGMSASSLVNAAPLKMIVQDGGKKNEIEASKLPEKVTKSIMDANKDRKIVKAFQLVDAAELLTGYEVVVLTDKKEEVFKFDKNGDMKKEVITPNPGKTEGSN